MRIGFATLATALSVCALFAGQDDLYRYTRSLRTGDRVRYELRQRTEGASGEVVAIAGLSVEGEPIAEKVRWLSLATNGNEPRPINLPTYDLFANPRSVLRQLPSADADLTGIITDFYTFFFAASPLAGITEVSARGATYIRPEVVTGDWSDGSLFPLGQDHLRVTLRLRSLDSTSATFTTTFAPPTERTWTMHRPWMEPSVCGSQPNNFQMVRRQGAQFIAIWGCEEFSIETDVERATGRILRADMNNALRWHVRACQDEALTQCIDAPAINRARAASLRVVP